MHKSHLIYNRNTKNEKEYVLIYHRSNYKWFLKKVLENKDGRKIQKFNWSLSNSYRMFLTYIDGAFEIFDFVMDYQTSGRSTYQ